MRRILAALLLTALPLPAAAAPADDLARLLDDHWAWTLKNSPLTATQVGVRDYDGELGDFSMAADARQVAEAKAFLARLDAISDAGLSPVERDNRAILRLLLVQRIESEGFAADRLTTVSALGSWFQWLAGLGDQVPLLTRADYDSYLARLEKIPAANAAMLARTREGVRQGIVQPCVTLGGVERTARGVVTAKVEDSRFYAPFAAPRPATIAAADWAAMQARAKAIITTRLNPDYARIADFLRDTYIPACRQPVGISALPGGADYYRWLVKRETTTDLTPQAIHDLGLREVARIRAEMAAVAAKAGFASREAMIADLRTAPRHYAKTPEELMEAVARQAKIIDGKMPTLFGRLPRLPYGVKEIPAETAEGSTTAYYMPGAPDAGIAGFYFVNTSKLDQRPYWEVPALTVHEAVPGHHHQIALQQEIDLPPFRRHVAFFTAFTEGWGLYSERLGIEMGLYDTPEKDMGRLSYEMWRACRLVVDTGIHALGWDKAKAVAFMKDNSALTDANIDAEVNRYIGNPGQALAYKLGELKIRELRERAETALGNRFDLRAFHDTVLESGSVPLDLLEAHVTRWIDAEKAKPAA